MPYKYGKKLRLPKKKKKLGKTFTFGDAREFSKAIGADKK